MTEANARKHQTFIGYIILKDGDQRKMQIGKITSGTSTENTRQFQYNILEGSLRGGGGVSYGAFHKKMVRK